MPWAIGNSVAVLVCLLYPLCKNDHSVGWFEPEVVETFVTLSQKYPGESFYILLWHEPCTKRIWSERSCYYLHSGYGRGTIGHMTTECKLQPRGHEKCVHAIVSCARSLRIGAATRLQRHQTTAYREENAGWIVDNGAARWLKEIEKDCSEAKASIH